MPHDVTSPLFDANKHTHTHMRLTTACSCPCAFPWPALQLNHKASGWHIAVSVPAATSTSLPEPRILNAPTGYIPDAPKPHAGYICGCIYSAPWSHCGTVQLCLTEVRTYWFFQKTDTAIMFVFGCGGSFIWDLVGAPRWSYGLVYGVVCVGSVTWWELQYEEQTHHLNYEQNLSRNFRCFR